MGNEQPKAPQKKQLTQFQVDVACLKVKGYVELHRDRRTNQALMKEKNLNEVLRQPTRTKVDEYQKFQSLVQDVRFIETCNIVIRYSDIIKDQSIRICKSNGDASQIGDVMPYIESILFAADNLNLQQVVEFKDLMVFFFGPGLYDTNKLLNVDPDMKKLYKNPLPDAFEINEYVIKFAAKYGFSEDQINAVGHQFSSKFLQPAVGGIQVNISQGYQGGFGNQPNQQQFGGPGGFPQSHTGGNGFGNDFPPPNGGFGNQSQGFGNNQNGFNGGNHNDYGYPNGGYGGNQQQFNQPTGFQPLPPPNQGGFPNPQQGGGNTGGFGGNPSGLGGPTGGLGGPTGGFSGNPSGLGGPTGGFSGNPSGLGGPTGGLGGNPSGLSGPTGGYGGPTNGYGGATGGYSGVGDGFGGNTGGYGGATGGFGGNTGATGGFGTPQQMGPSSSNPYANLGTPYQAQTQAPPIMASLSMKVPPQQQQPQQPQQQFVPQPQQPVPQQPYQPSQQKNQDLDDLEARLAKLQQGL